jgi:hypothetical protein
MEKYDKEDGLQGETDTSGNRVFRTYFEKRIRDRKWKILMEA